MIWDMSNDGRDKTVWLIAFGFCIASMFCA